MRAFGLALVIVTLCTVSVSAQEGGRGGGRGNFDPGAMMTRIVAPTIVKVADADNSGDVTGKEWKSFTESLKKDDSGAIDGDAFKSDTCPRSTGISTFIESSRFICRVTTRTNRRINDIGIVKINLHIMYVHFRC